MKQRSMEMVIGLIGAVFGIMAGYMAYTMRTLSQVLSKHDPSLIITLSIATVILSIIGGIGAILVRRNTRLGAIVMIVPGIAVLFTMSVYDSMGGILLIVAGMVALFRKVPS